MRIFQNIDGIANIHVATMSDRWSDMVETTDDGFELRSSGFSLRNQIGDGVDPGECFGVGEANE